MADKDIQLPEIFGLPPGSSKSSSIIKASMPIAEIAPQIPEFKEGLSIFKLKKAWEYGPTTHPSYTSMLSDLGYSIPGKCVKVAFLADNFPTDTFSNEYGGSFLEKITSMTSGVGEIAQVFGAGSIGELSKATGATFKEMGKNMGGPTGTGFNWLGDFFSKGSGAEAKLNEMANQQVGKPAGKILKTMSQMLAGGRVDFPQVWKGSGFQPSYTMTIRLYNPDPSSKPLTEKYIIGPIAALMLLATPISESGDVYNWPYLHKIKSLGIFNLNPAYISNVTIVKGGDQQQIGFNQRLGIVDVRIDFGSLYASMIAVKGGGISNRPTLKTYIDAMKESKSIDEKKLGSVSEKKTKKLIAKYPNLKSNISTTTTPTDRVDSEKKNVAESLGC